MAGALPCRIPLFPLPTTVLFPGTPLPLHIFEPRYQAMMNDVLAGPSVIGMVLLKPGWENDYEGRPSVFGIGCAGIVAQHERLADGRFNLTLLGQKKFRIIGEEDQKPYRIAHVEYIEEQTPAAPDETSGFRVNVVSKINAIAKAGGATENLLTQQSASQIPDAEFVNVLSHALAFSPLEKQALLEESGPFARYLKLIDILDFWRLGIGRETGTAQ